MGLADADRKMSSMPYSRGKDALVVTDDCLVLVKSKHILHRSGCSLPSDIGLYSAAI